MIVNDIILITNDISLIDLYENDLLITNSIAVSLEYLANCQYIIVDESQLSLEEDILEKVIPYKYKTLLIGYRIHKDFITVNKLDFNPKNIESYFSQPSGDTIDFKSNLSDEMDSLIENYIYGVIPIKEISKSLKRANKVHRILFYDYINVLRNKRINSLPFYDKIRLEYNIYNIKEHFKNKHNKSKASPDNY